MQRVMQQATATGVTAAWEGVKNAWKRSVVPALLRGLVMSAQAAWQALRGSLVKDLLAAARVWSRGLAAAGEEGR